MRLRDAVSSMPPEHLSTRPKPELSDFQDRMVPMTRVSGLTEEEIQQVLLRIAELSEVSTLPRAGRLD
jgi:hypothetical protein